MAKKGHGTVLPQTAPDLVADMFQVFNDLLQNEVLSQSISERLTNPDTCPIGFLPYLAWGLGMHYWPSELDEAGQRQQVKDWWENSKKVGTVGAVKRALNRFGQTYQVVEWFEDVPGTETQTFCVVIEVGENGILGLTPQYMVDSVRRAKKLTAHLNKFRFVLRSSGQHYTAIVARVGIKIKYGPLVIA